MARTRLDIQRRQDDSVLAMLGQARYEKFKEYEDGRVYRVQASNMAKTLTAAGTSLTDAQMRPFVDAYVAEETRRREHLKNSASTDDEAADLELRADGNRRILDAMRPHLSTQQFDALQNMFDQSLSQKRAELRVASDHAGAQAR